MFPTPRSASWSLVAGDSASTCSGWGACCARWGANWDVVREPEAIRPGRTLIFPDFMLCHRLQPERRVLVEIVGFWTPEYLATKLARLREAKLFNFILCIDADRGCAQEDLPQGISVLRFRRRVDAVVVLAEAARLTSGSPAS